MPFSRRSLGVHLSRTIRLHSVRAGDPASVPHIVRPPQNPTKTPFELIRLISSFTKATLGLRDASGWTGPAFSLRFTARFMTLPNNGNLFVRAVCDSYG